MRSTNRAAIVALFLTLCLAGKGVPATLGYQSPWRFAYVTDTHVNWIFGGTSPRNSVMLNDVVDTLLTLGNFKALILGGDWSEQLIHDNANANADSFAVFLARANGYFPVYPVEGNWEAIVSDTAAYGDPYVSARSRFSGYFGTLDWYYKDLLNVRFVALQNCANVDTTAALDYRQNNPYGGVVNGRAYSLNDFSGITAAASPQRTFLAEVLASREDAHWLIVATHRPVYGSNEGASNRLNLISAARGSGYVKQIEDALGTGERGLHLVGDQHIPLWFTYAIADSAIASATGKGLYHYLCTSGAGARVADTTDVLGSTSLQSFLYYNGANPERMYGRTSEAWADTITLVGDPATNYTFTWTLFTVYGDDMLVETFRTWASGSAGHAKYTGAGSHRLVDVRTLHRDN